MKFKNVMQTLFKRYRSLYLIIIAVTTTIDQLSKSYLINVLPKKFEYSFDLLPFLKIVYAWNYGISFGLFSGYYQYSNYFFIAINLLITLYLLYLLIYDAEYNKIALSLIIGGAIGNLIDRLIRGAVFDFIFLYYEKYSFPAFNMADAFISAGALIFLIDFCHQKNKN